MKKKEMFEKIDFLLEEMNLSHLKKSKASSLSGGERRRLEVARTLALSPSLILLDEPFAAIDPKVVEALQQVILSLKKRNIGVLITDHKPRETLAISDRGYVLVEGKILKHGVPKELEEDFLVRQLYLGEKFNL